MPVVTNKKIEDLITAKDNFSKAVAQEEGSKDSAIQKAEEFLLTLRGYLETVQQRMDAAIKEMQELKKIVLAKQGRSGTEELPAIGSERETRGVAPVAAKAARKQTSFLERDKIVLEIDAFKEMLGQIQDHLTEFNLAMANYMIRIGNKYKFLLLADEDVAYLPEVKKKISSDSDIFLEINNLKSSWEYFGSLDNDLMETITEWSLSVDKKKSEIEGIDDCIEALAEFSAFLKNAKGKIDKLGKCLKVHHTRQFGILMQLTYNLIKEAKLY